MRVDCFDSLALARNDLNYLNYPNHLRYLNYLAYLTSRSLGGGKLPKLSSTFLICCMSMIVSNLPGTAPPG